MKNKISLILIIAQLTLICNLLNGQNFFQQIYGKPASDKAFCILPLSDGSFVVSGQGAGSMNDQLVFKIDSIGNVLWSKTYGGSQNEEGRVIVQCPDNGFIISGWTLSYGQGNFDALLTKIDSNGNLEWQKIYGGPGIDAFWPIDIANDNSLYAAGWTESFGLGGTDAFIIKTDLNGDTIWTRTFGNNGEDFFRALTSTTDNGCLAVGETNSYGVGSDYNIMAIRLNANGDTLWTKYIGDSSGDDFAWTVKETSDGGFIIGGNTGSFGAGNGTDDAIITKLDVNGNIVWCKTIGNQYINTCRSILQNNNGEFVFCGYSGISLGAAGENGLLAKLNFVGDTIWTKSIGGTNQEHLRYISAVNSNDLISCGYTKSFGSGLEDIIIIKLNNQGVLSNCNLVNTSLSVTSRTISISDGISYSFCSPNISVASQNSPTLYTNSLLCDTTLITFSNDILQNVFFSIYPNPFLEQAVLTSSKTLNNASIQIHNVLGQCVKTIEEVNGNEVIIEKEELEEGVYFVQVIEQNKIIAVKKVLVIE